MKIRAKKSARKFLKLAKEGQRNWMKNRRQSLQILESKDNERNPSQIPETFPSKSVLLVGRVGYPENSVSSTTEAGSQIEKPSFQHEEGRHKKYKP